MTPLALGVKIISPLLLIVIDAQFKTSSSSFFISLFSGFST
jgi:hypothetical protein